MLGVMVLVVFKASPLASLAIAITLGPGGVSVSIASLCEVRSSSESDECHHTYCSMHHASMHGNMVARQLDDGSC